MGAQALPFKTATMSRILEVPAAERGDYVARMMLRRVRFAQVLRLRTLRGWLAAVMALLSGGKPPPELLELDVLNRPPRRGADPPVSAPRALTSAITRHGPPTAAPRGGRRAHVWKDPPAP